MFHTFPPMVVVKLPPLTGAAFFLRWFAAAARLVAMDVTRRIPSQMLMQNEHRVFVVR